MKIVGIDPSLSSTAVCILDGQKEEFHCFMSASKSTKWMKAMEVIARMHQVQYKTVKDYSDSEVQKLRDYERVANGIVDSLGIGEDDRVIIEGYAQRASGQIVDLVMFSTFIRKRVLDLGARLTVVAPMTLKKSWAELIYPKDKKGVARNYEIQKNGLGIAGGSFKKHQMMLGLYEMSDDSRFRDCMLIHREEIMPLASIPSPMNDLVDAFAAAWLGKNGVI